MLMVAVWASGYVCSLGDMVFALWAVLCHKLLIWRVSTCVTLKIVTCKPWLTMFWHRAARKAYHHVETCTMSQCKLESADQ